LPAVHSGYLECESEGTTTTPYVVVSAAPCVYREPRTTSPRGRGGGLCMSFRAIHLLGLLSAGGLFGGGDVARHGPAIHHLRTSAPRIADTCRAKLGRAFLSEGGAPSPLSDLCSRVPLAPTLLLLHLTCFQLGTLAAWQLRSAHFLWLCVNWSYGAQVAGLSRYPS
jgi:hypothetical protein